MCFKINLVGDPIVTPAFLSSKEGLILHAQPIFRRLANECSAELMDQRTLVVGQNIAGELASRGARAVASRDSDSSDITARAPASD